MLTNTQYKTFNNQFTWRIDEDGLLRCTTNVLKSCVMKYTVEELGRDNVPQELRNKETLDIYVPEEELAKQESLDSLEGKPVSVDHIWQTGGSIDSVGNVAGTPTFDRATGFLKADILVTDPATIKRITSSDDSSKLVDQSAAYRNVIEYSPGATDEGEHYDGIQRGIFYNHIALLPKGKGRAGEEVRILNKDRGTAVSEFTLMKVGKSSIRVLNEDVDKLENEIDEKEREMKNAADKLKNKDDDDKEKDKKDEETKKKSDDEMKSQNEKLIGQVEILNEQIARLNSPESIQNSINEAIQEKTQASEIMNSYVGGDKAANEESIKSLNGHELRKFVVSKVRTMNKKTDLTEEEAKQDRVSGMFTALSFTSGLVGKKTVAGAEVIQTMNSGQESGLYDTAEKRAKHEKEKHQAHFKKNMAT